MANALVNGIGDSLVGEEKCNVEVLLGYGDDVVDDSESVDDGEEVCLDLEVVLSNVDGDDEMRPLGSGEFFDEGLVFLTEKGEPCMWCVRGEGGGCVRMPSKQWVGFERCQSLQEKGWGGGEWWL